MNPNPSIRVCSRVLCAAALTACSPPKPAALPTPKVTVSQPQLATVTNWDEYPGHLEAVEMVEIRPRVSGYIDSIHFQDGAEVKAGDLLFVIDPRPYQADLEQAQARRQQAETHLELSAERPQTRRELCGAPRRFPRRNTTAAAKRSAKAKPRWPPPRPTRPPPASTWTTPRSRRPSAARSAAAC